MRHLVKGKKLGRNTSHRKATMKALSCSLIEHKSIRTTVAKAKELRRYIEPVITKAKEDTSHTRRQAFSSLQNKHAVKELFDEVIPAVGDRPGGYTRVLKLGFRLGDSAEMALIELVDFSDYQPETKTAKKKRTRRAGKSNKPTPADVETETSGEEETATAENADDKEESKSKTTESASEDTSDVVEESGYTEEDTEDKKVTAESDKETSSESEKDASDETDEEKSK